MTFLASPTIRPRLGLRAASILSWSSLCPRPLRTLYWWAFSSDTCILLAISRVKLLPPTLAEPVMRIAESSRTAISVLVAPTSITSVVRLPSSVLVRMRATAFMLGSTATGRRSTSLATCVTVSTSARGAAETTTIRVSLVRLIIS